LLPLASEFSISLSNECFEIVWSNGILVLGELLLLIDQYLLLFALGVLAGVETPEDFADLAVEAV
jgi:hypothetical protein